MSQDEIAVMDGGKCIMQLRGVRPFFSDKFDITKHKQYRKLSDNGLVPDNKHNKKLKKSVQAKGKELKQTFKNDVFRLGSSTITVLGPTVYNSNKGNDAVNNNSLFLMVQHGSKSLLITGDALIQEQNHILDSGTAVSCDVLKVPHHGFKNASNERFIKAAAPTYAVCSCPKLTKPSKINNWKPFSLIAQNGSKIFATGFQDNIVMVSDGKNIYMNLEPLFGQ